jgi:hypothetical protein
MDYLISVGLSEDYAKMMSGLEGMIASGVEEKNYESDIKLAGKVSLKEFVEANKAVWAKA